MKTLHLYVLRQAVTTLVMTVCVFAFVLLLGNILREILALLVNRQATVGLILQAILLLLPWIMAYVLPFALLAAMLLLFGRLSADNELTAVRASGISLLSLITPLLILALAMSALCAYFNLKLTPQSRVAYKRLTLTLLTQNSDLIITEDRFIKEIPGIILYFRKRHAEHLEDVCLYKLDDAKKSIISRATAARGRILWGPDRDTIAFQLEDAVTEQLYWREQEVRDAPPALNVTNLLGSNPIQALTNLPAGPVIGRIRYPEWVFFQAGSIQTDPESITNLVRVPDRPAKISEMTFPQLREELQKLRQQGVGITPVLVQMHRQIAFSFAPFAFTLVAIPLGIRAHRRETTVGMALSLILALAYYTFLIVGEALQLRENLHPHLIIWIPNVLFQTLGAILLWRANRMG